MPAILTPSLALRYLRELSTDLRAAAVLAADGSQLAGDPAAAGPARELLAALDAAGPDARELIVRIEPDGTLRGHALIARTGAREAAAAVALAVGPHALLPLLRHDLAAALDGLAAGSSGGGDAVQAVDIRPAPVTVIDADGRSRAPEAGDFTVRTAIFAGSEMLAAAMAASSGQ